MQFLRRHGSGFGTRGSRKLLLKPGRVLAGLVAGGRSGSIPALLPKDASFLGEKHAARSMGELLSADRR